MIPRANIVVKYWHPHYSGSSRNWDFSSQYYKRTGLGRDCGTFNNIFKESRAIHSNTGIKMGIKHSIFHISFGILNADLSCLFGNVEGKQIDKKSHFGHFPPSFHRGIGLVRL